MHLLYLTLLLTVLSSTLNCELYSLSALAHRCIHAESAFQSHLSANLLQVPQFYNTSNVNQPDTLNFESASPPPKAKHSEPMHSKRMSAGWEPIRIFVDTSHLADRSKICTAVGEVRPDFLGSRITCTPDDILTVEKLWVVERLVVPLAVRMVGYFLNVIPINGTLVVPAAACDADMTIPLAHTTAGVTNADIILYVLAAAYRDTVRTEPSGHIETVAWAGHCAVDQSGRPVVGRINIVPSSIAWHASGWALDNYVRIIAHELFHAFGFTPELLKKMVHTSERRGKAVTLVTASAVVAAARQHLNCAALNGVELEDEGGVGTAETHWERRQWMDEVMVGITTRAAISSISLAFFDSLGFYKVNMEYKESMLWSRNAGCGFVDVPCTDASSHMGIEWCNQSAAKAICTSDYTAVGFCNLGTVQNLPAYFQYFSSHPTRGGLTPLMDYCPIVTPYKNRRCQNPSSANADDPVYGNYYGEQSRCISTSRMVRIGYTTDDTSPRCLRMRCSRGTRLEVFIGGYWLECPGDGGAGDIVIPPRTGFRGTVHCAPASRVCTPGLYSALGEQSPPREFAIDVILVLRATNASEHARLPSAAAHFPGEFFVRLASDLLRLCARAHSAGTVRLLPEMATAAATSRGGVLVYAQLGITAHGAAAAMERQRMALKSHIGAGQAMRRVGETVIMDAAEILPESTVVDSTTALSNVFALADLTVRLVGECLAGILTFDAKAKELLSHAAQQDLSKVLYVTTNLVRVQQVRMLDSAMLSISVTMDFPPAPDTSSVDNAEAITDTWRRQLTALLKNATVFPVLTSTVCRLSQGVPLSVGNATDFVGLSMQSVEVQRAQPLDSEVSPCIVIFGYCFTVQMVVQVFGILIAAGLVAVYVFKCL